MSAKRRWPIYLLSKARPGIRYSEHLEGNGAEIFAQACRMGLEGIVSKKLTSPYRSGKANKDMVEDQKSEVAGNVAVRRQRVMFDPASDLNDGKPWTRLDFHYLKIAMGRLADQATR